MEVAIPLEHDEPALDEAGSSEKIRWVNAALSAIQSREHEFETGWWEHAKKAESIYSPDKTDKINTEPYNILYSNTEVLLPALYSSTPKPDIRSRFKGQDIKPLPEMLQRFLTVAADPASPGGDCFDNAMGDAVLQALVPGMGFVRIRYVEDRSFPLTYESGQYNSLIWGKALRWSKAPWIAFKHSMKREVMLKKFNLQDQRGQAGGLAGALSPESEKDTDDCTVYELWDKATKRVYWLSGEWHEKLLHEVGDPLGLENFYPTPGLLVLTPLTGKFIPIPLYNYYQNQAEELNRVSVRLNRVLSAIRVRGAYNGLMGDDLKKLLAADELDNELVAAGEAALLAQTGGFDKHIWLLPIERFIEVANQLYKAREAIKQVIYELTGISDIIRGSSVASETATAQDLKNKWGTVRLRRMQRVVADYARDLFRMSVDCGADHVAPEKWKEITQLSIPTQQEKQLAQQQLQYAAQMAQMAPGMPPQPPDPKLVKTAQSPSIEELLGKIKSDQNRTYIINIQTSSTIDLDTAQDKAEVTEFMNAMGQLMAPLGGLAQMGPTGMDAAKALLAAVCQRYKFGLDLADVIMAIEPPKPQQGNPEAEKKLAESQKQLDQQAEANKAEAEKLAFERKAFELEKRKAELELEFKATKAKLEQDFSQREMELGLRTKIKEAALDRQFSEQKQALSQEQHTANTRLEADRTAFKQEPARKNAEGVDKTISSLTETMAQLTKALSARKSVKDSTGKTYTLEIESGAESESKSESE